MSAPATDQPTPPAPTSRLARIKASFKGGANWMARIFGLVGMVPPAR